MLVRLDLPGARLRDVARTLKRAFDDLQEADSGWWYVDFDHPAFGREEAGSPAERIPGPIIPTTDEPGAAADALVAVVGYVDSFTGDVHLGNGMVVPSAERERAPQTDQEGGDYPDRRLPAVALFDDNGLSTLIGTLHQTREARFETVSLGETVDTAIREWLEEIARGQR